MVSLQSYGNSHASVNLELRTVTAKWQCSNGDHQYTVYTLTR